MMAIFMAAVEVTIVATAMPTIVADLGGARFFSWVFATYLLTQAVTTPIYGRLADIYGRKKVFVAGSSLFLSAPRRAASPGA
jgi:MFS family permease